MKRRVFFVSDRTGITVQALGQSLLTQFPGIEFSMRTLPFVKNQVAAQHAADVIRAARAEDGVSPLVFSTLTDPATQYIIAGSNEHVFDLFGTFIEPLEDVLGQESSHTAGRMHGMSDAGAYEKRLSALNFTLSHDDGVTLRDLHDSDVVLVGVSRCGKTPTCLYLAMQYSLKASNYPLTEDDFARSRLPPALETCRDKIQGLTIQPEQLSRIRYERRPHGPYSTLAQCRREVSLAETLFRNEKLPFLDTTTVSIEEIAATVVRDRGLR